MPVARFVPLRSMVLRALRHLPESFPLEGTSWRFLGTATLSPLPQLCRSGGGTDAPCKWRVVPQTRLALIWERGPRSAPLG